MFRTPETPQERSPNPASDPQRTIIVMKVTVGVSGGIAAYKAAELVRALQRQALDVHVVMTEAAQRFITPLTFASLTGHKVITGLWPSSAWREAILIPPSNTLGQAQIDRGPGRCAGNRQRAGEIRSWAGRRLPDHHVSGHPCAGYCGSGDERQHVGASGHPGATWRFWKSVGSGSCPRKRVLWPVA